MAEPAVIRLSQFIHHPPARVWQALTDPALHAQWWAAGDVQPTIGHTFTLDMGQWGQQPCEVLAVEPERMLSYRFARFMTITWRLEAEAAGTRLYLEHSGFDLDSPLGRQAYEGMSGGWPGILQRIEPALRAA